MKIHDQGILKNSDLYFQTPSKQAKDMYFYQLCSGHYYCDGTYMVNRQSYDSFLIIYVCNGCGFVEQNGHHISVKEGSVAFIDCYKPHMYGTKSGWEIYWVHFDGILARQYFDVATSNGIVLNLQNPYNAKLIVEKIYDRSHGEKKVKEVVMSKYITDLLTELILCAQSIVTLQGQSNNIEEILSYISENAYKSLTLNELAKRASLSPYYFTRVFKKEVGFTPHKYIIHVRLEFAKFLLKTTNTSIKEIAFRSGFNNQSNFCTSFKKLTGVSPLQFRGQREEKLFQKDYKQK